jgi:hypothetical protein
MPGTNLLVLFGLLCYLSASFALWHILLRQPASHGFRGRRRRRWPVRLAKALATLVGGAASGGASLLVVATIVNAGKPGTMSTNAMLAVWAVFTVVAMLFIGRAPLIRRVVTRTCLALGLHGVVLPLATLIAFMVAGARLAGSAGAGAERALVVMGVRLAGNLPAVWIGLGGFGIGLALMILGDRARWRTGRPRLPRRPDASRRFRSSRAGGPTARTRPR